MDKLITVLEESVKINGPEKILTLGHLLNIAKMIKRMDDHEADLNNQSDIDAYNATQDGYGS